MFRDDGESHFSRPDTSDQLAKRNMVKTEDNVCVTSYIFFTMSVSLVIVFWVACECVRVHFLLSDSNRTCAVK
jgi:hypothetical protein